MDLPLRQLVYNGRHIQNKNNSVVPNFVMKNRSYLVTKATQNAGLIG